MSGLGDWELDMDYNRYGRYNYDISKAASFLRVLRFRSGGIMLSLRIPNLV
jgi:hypothetical protein